MTSPSITHPEATPQVSVVIVVLDGNQNLVRCLEALQRQQSPPPMEIIVAHDERLADVADWQRRFAGVRFVHSPRLRNFPVMRTAGARVARGAIIAVTEDQCIPPPDWCRNIVAAHAAQRAAAIGGPVDKQGRDSALNWAIYLRELGVGYMPPVADGPSAHLTDCNVTYKRAALEAIADVWREEFHEPQVHGALQARGETLWLAPGLLTLQQRTFALGAALRERYEFGRLYGSLRVKGTPLSKRLVMALASLLLPLLLTARVVLTAFRKGRHRWQCIRTLPHLFLLAGMWSWGEFLGYLTAQPSASRRAAA